jgi:formamidopyrimidine-DNA glycosylase
MQILRERRGRLKPLLMHQQVIAGIGNIYANEILFRVGLHPNRETSRIRDATRAKLYDTMQTVLKEAIAEGGSSVRDFFAPDGSEGQYKRHHLAYGKEGHPCPNGCGRLIRRLQSERSSFFCPHCQSKKVSG